MSMFAIIRIGGKQYKVSKGDKIKTELLDAKVGEKLAFDDVLLVGDLPRPSKGRGEKVKIGTPKVSGAKVEAKILKQGKAKKVVIFKYKPKKRYKKKLGHRQLYTEVEITKINF